MDKIFDAQMQERLRAAVQAAEAKTRGQIVPVVVEKSERYPEARYLGGLLGLALVTVVAVFFEAHLLLTELALLQAGGLVLGACAAMWDPIERLVIGRRALMEAASDRARRAFLEHGLQKTQDGAGVLIFASLFEHAVVVLGDSGIDAKMGQKGWEHVVKVLVKGLRKGTPGEGFLEAISLCGHTLAEAFPASAGPTRGNELPDHLRVDKS